MGETKLLTKSPTEINYQYFFIWQKYEQILKLTEYKKINYSTSKTNSFHFEILFGFSHSEAKFQKVLNIIKKKINKHHSTAQTRVEIFQSFHTCFNCNAKFNFKMLNVYITEILKLNFFLHTFFCVGVSDTNTKK
jgi:hypothetical protein